MHCHLSSAPWLPCACCRWGRDQLPWGWPERRGRPHQRWERQRAPRKPWGRQGQYSMLPYGTHVVQCQHHGQVAISRIATWELSSIQLCRRYVLYVVADICVKSNSMTCLRDGHTFVYILNLVLRGGDKSWIRHPTKNQLRYLQTSGRHLFRADLAKSMFEV